MHHRIPSLLAAAFALGCAGAAHAAASEYAWTGTGIEMLGHYDAKITAVKGMFSTDPWYAVGIVQEIDIDNNGSGGVDLTTGVNNVAVEGNNTFTLTPVPANKTYAARNTYVDGNGPSDPLDTYTVHETWSVKRGSSGIAIGAVKASAHQFEFAIASITADNGSGQAVVVTSLTPTGLTAGTVLAIEGATNPLNDVTALVASVVGKNVTLTTALTANQASAAGQIHWGISQTGSLTFTMYPKRAVSLVDSRYIGKILSATNDAKMVAASSQVRIQTGALTPTNDTYGFYDSPYSLDACWVGTKMTAGAVVNINGADILDRLVVTVTANGEPVSAVRTMRNLSSPSAPIATYTYGLYHSRTQLEIAFGADSTTGDWDLTPVTVTGTALASQYTVGVVETAGFSYSLGQATVNQPAGSLTDPDGRAWWDGKLASAMTQYDPTGPDPGTNQMWRLTLANSTGIQFTGGTLELLALDPTTHQIVATSASMTFTLTPQ